MKKMYKSFVAAMSALCMLLTLLPAGVYASDGVYAVTVNVAPSTAGVSFYSCNGYDEEGYDVLGAELAATDAGTDETTGYRVYTLSLPEGTYSYRAVDAQGSSLGGMTFDIPPGSEQDDTSSQSCEITLRQVDVYTTTKIADSYATASQYTTQVADADGKLATAGAAYVDSSSRTRYPYLLCANGNAELYTVKLIPTEEIGSTYSLGTNTMLNYTVTKGTSATTKSGMLPTLIDAVITAPAESRVQVFNQLRNFYTQEVEYSARTESDGIASYTYRLPKNSGSHTYRVSMGGKITKAGYLKLTSSDTAKADITFAEDENPKIRPEYDTSTAIGSRMEDNILLNINKQNYLRLNVGESFKARAYRAWQIINSDTANIMIEPDFEYKIISGDSIQLEQQGQNAIITAVKDGISLVEVTYDAIEIGGNTSYAGIYGAIDPMRKGLFAVNVGGNTDTQITLPEWDSDFDTVYFEGETGTLDFAPAAEGDLMVECNGERVEPDEKGSYTLTINQGNNIVAVTSGDTAEYMIIKGNKLTVHIENATAPGEDIRQGDTVNISFDGLHMPMPKFSGVYNPGFGNTIKAAYTANGSGKAQSKGAQYNFINNHTISMTVYDKGTVALTEGHIPLTSMGFVPGSHRELTDTGIGANFSAASVSCSFCVLPDISFEIAKNDDLTYMSAARESFCNLSSVNILCGTSTYQNAFVFNLTTEKNASVKNTSKTFTTAKFKSDYPFSVTAVPSNSDVTMELRYWELGDSEKTIVPLTAGQAYSLEKNPFRGDRPIYMEIAVTPVNPVFGDETVYSYVAYNTGNDADGNPCPRPILKTLDVTDTDGNAFALPYGVLHSSDGSGLSFTETDYICYIPNDTQAVSLSLARQIGTNDVTVNGTTQSLATSAVTIPQIAASGDETQVAVELADGAVYNIRLIKTSGTISSAAYDDEKIAVSLMNTHDTEYKFYLAAYNGGKLQQLMTDSRQVAPGENTLFFDRSDFDGEVIRLFVWGGNLKPVLCENIN